MRYLALLSVLALLIVSTDPVMAQRERRHQPPSPEKLRERIEDLRKVKLLDVLDLQGDQIEKFFAVYNKYNNKIDAAKEKIDEKSRELQGAISGKSSDAELKRLTKELRSHMKEMGNLMDQRFDEVQPVLDATQFAQYVVFESRFREELQRMILDRVRRMRD